MGTMIEVAVARLGVDSGSNSYVVILRERDGERVLPIWIGAPEAEAILLEINHVKKERPLTHDLCKALVQALGARVDRVLVTRVQQGTYFAEVHLVRDGEHLRVDARPSDSIALALRARAPIFVSAGLLADGDDQPAEQGPPSPAAPEDEARAAAELQDYLRSLRPEDFGRFSL